MYNWDYDLPKNWRPKTDAEWQWYLTRLINYGLHGEKINIETLKKYFGNLKIDPQKKTFLKFILKKNEDDIKR